MSAQTPAGVRPAALFKRAWRENPALTLNGVAMAVVLVGFLIGIAVDSRVITGVPAWLKPAKFALSSGIYCFTLLWLMTYVRGLRWVKHIVSWGISLALGLEVILIAAAAAEGTTSHFNVSTPRKEAIWGVMATAITLTWLLSVVVALLLLRQKKTDPALASALRWGLVIALVGMAIGLLMTTPSADQLAAAKGGSMPIAGAHSVGVPDGGPGLPILNWSTVGGDLRVPHFFGLHALQVMPFVWYAIARLRRDRFSVRRRLALVRVVALGYLAFVFLLTWQAGRGQPLIKPDAVTLAAAGVLVLAAAVLTAAALFLTRGPSGQRHHGERLQPEEAAGAGETHLPHAGAGAERQPVVDRYW